MLLFLTTLPAHAYPPYRRLAAAYYNRQIGCELCHAAQGSTERNVFGDAWRARGENDDAFTALANGDLDHDSVANVDEIRAGSNPSDAASVPNDPGRYAAHARDVYIPREQLRVVLDAPERIDVVEPILTRDQLAALKTALGREPSVTERLPTIYLATHNGVPDTAVMFGRTGTGKNAISIVVAVDTHGLVQRTAIYRVGDETGAAYQTYMQCFINRSLVGTPKSGAIPCSNVTASPVRLSSITAAVHDLLATMTIAFGDGA